MIKNISNIAQSTDETRISIEARMVSKDNNDQYIYQTPSTIPNAQGYFYKIAKYEALFIKIKFYNLSSTEEIRRALFNLEILCSPTNASLKLYKLPQHITSFDTIASHLIGRLSTSAIYLIDQVAVPKVINYASSSNIHQTVYFDIANLVKMYAGSEPEFIFAITRDDLSSPLVSFYVPEYVDAAGGEVASAVITQDCGINILNSYNNVSFSNYDNGYINLRNGEIIHLFKTFNTISKKMPVSVDFAHYQNRITASKILPYKFKCNFEYQIYLENNLLIIEDYTGNKLAYRKLSENLTNAHYESLGIKHVDSTNKNKLYFCNEDGSYLFKTDEQTGERIIEKYDYLDNYSKFIVNISNNNTQIRKIRNQNGDVINFNWESISNYYNRLLNISDENNELITFSYDNSYRLSAIEFINEHKLISFSYSSSPRKTTYNIYNVNSTNVLISTIEIVLSSEDFIISAKEKNSSSVTKRSINYTYNSSKVSIVEVFDKNNNVIDRSNYTFYQDYTNVTNGNDAIKYYFDKYNRVITKINNYGIVQTANYGEIENGVLKGELCASPAIPLLRNFLENHSFEYLDNNGDIMSWEKTGTGEAILSNEGLYGNKCLYINTINTQTLWLKQIISSISNGTYTLKCKAKGVINNSVKIKIGIYDKYAAHSPTVFETSFTNLTTEWKEYSCIANITALSNNDYVQVEIYSYGDNQFYIDDLQLNNSDQIIRYNMIENGDLENVDNSLPVGWLFDNLDILDGADFLDSGDSYYSPILGSRIMCFSKWHCQLDGTKFKIRKMYKQIQHIGKKNDKYTFSVFAKCASTINYIFRAFIAFDYDSVGEKKYYFDFETGLPTWQLLSRGIRAEDDYDSITIGIEYNGPKDAFLDSFQLYKDSNFNYYNYDIRGRITDISDVDGNHQKISYSNNLPSSLTLNDRSHFEYSYLTNGKIKKITDINGNTITYFYGQNDLEENITSLKITHGTEEIIKQFNYNSSDDLTSAIDEFLNETTYSYDYLKRLESVTLPNGCIQRLYYNNLSDLTCLAGFSNPNSSPDYVNNISYDSTLDEINSIWSYSGKQYNFTHDSNGRLLSISENGTTVHSFSYNNYINNIQTDLVTSKEYDASGDIFNFEYDDRSRLITVSLNNNIIYEYEYNEFSLVSAIKDHINNKVKYYSYDLSGNLVKVTNGDLIINYEYDNLGNVQDKIIKNNGKTIINSYDYDYEFNDYSKEGFLDRLGNNYGDAVVVSDHQGKGEYGLKYDYKNVAFYYDNNLKSNLFSFDDKRKTLIYNLKYLNSNRSSGSTYYNLEYWQIQFKYTKTFYIVFKPIGTSFGSVVNLFNFRGTKPSRYSISSLNIDEQGRINYISEGASTPTIITGLNEKVSLNHWNYLAFTIHYSNDISKGKIILKNDLGYYETSEIQISDYPYNIDEIIVSRQPINYSPIINQSSSSSQTDYTLSLPFYVSLFGFSNHNYSSDDHKSIFNAWQKYYGNNISRRNDSISYFNITSSVFDVIPLNGNTDSIKGLKAFVNPTDIIRFDREEESCFKYDDNMMRKVYSNFDSDGIKTLAYSLPFGYSGTLSFWFKLGSCNSRNRYLLSVANPSTNPLSLYINNDTLYAYRSGNVTSFSNINFGLLWHNLYLTWYPSSLHIYLDGVSLGTISIANLSNCITYIGCLYNSKYYALNGYIESIVFANSYMPNYISSVIKYRPKVIGYKKDTLDRVTSKNLIIDDNNYVTNYTYDKTRIISEQFNNNNVINYSYDNLGNVNHIQSVGKDEQYGYDLIGRLVSHNHNNNQYIDTYSYNANGDITRLQHTSSSSYSLVFNYTNNKLTSVKKNNNNYRIFTYPSNSFYPSEINFYNDDGTPFNQFEIVWQGKRLIKANLSGLTILEYKYDDNGILIYKYKPGEMSYFTLEGSNVISLKKVSPSGSYDPIILDFTYDSNNMLAGLTYNNKEYFYVRDILGNIYGIINSSGSYIVKYEYNAYGEVTKNIIATSGDDLIVANHNPYMYKGYYYDDALQCYYLKSRFYMPSICRFISPDDHSYLDYEDLRGINLYCYCYDNPVMYSDRDGSFPILTLILAGTFALGFGSSLFMNAATNNWQLDWRDFLQAGVDGAFAVGATMLAMTGIGLAGSIAAGAAMGWSQYAIGAGIQGDSITLAGSLTAIGIGALGGAISGAGAANSANIVKNMIGLSDDGVRAIGAITNAANRKAAGIISAKGLQATLNLYGKTAFNAVQAAIPGTMRRLFLSSARKIAFYTVLANASQSGLNYGYRAWGLI